MYFHPLILTEAQKQQRMAASLEFTRLWLDGMDRQHRLHTDAISEFCARQKENLQALAEALDGTRLVARCTVRAAPTQLELLRLSMRSTEIAADVLRQAGLLVDRHARELSRSVFERRVDDGVSSGPDLSNQRRSRRLQMMA
jgi:hypothetical protein